MFTDAACESTTSIGGVLFVSGQVPEVFGCNLRDEDTAEWKTNVDQRQVIGQAEIFPVLVATLTWAKKLAGKRVIFVIDYESTKIALIIRAYSPILVSLKIALECSTWDFHNDCISWYARVPTVCNIADSPSRLELSDYLIKLAQSSSPVAKRQLNV